MDYLGQELEGYIGCKRCQGTGVVDSWLNGLAVGVDCPVCDGYGVLEEEEDGEGDDS